MFWGSRRLSESKDSAMCLSVSVSEQSALASCAVPGVFLKVSKACAHRSSWQRCPGWERGWGTHCMLPNISGFSSWRNQRSFLCVFGPARIARQLSQLSPGLGQPHKVHWEKSLWQQTQGLRSCPGVGSYLSLSSGGIPRCYSYILELYWCSSGEIWQVLSVKTLNKLPSWSLQPVYGIVFPL